MTISNVCVIMLPWDCSAETIGMEMFVDERCWVTKPSEVRDYLFMYERVIPEVLRDYDPQTFYWPASPSSGGSFDNPNDPDERRCALLAGMAWK